MSTESPLKCNVLRESLSMDNKNIPCATLKRRGSRVISVVYLPEECRLFGILLLSSLLLLFPRPAQEAEGERFALAEGALQVCGNKSLGCAEGLLRLLAGLCSSLVCYLLFVRIVRLILLLGIRIKPAITQC
jgi:hypothetical protein